MVKYLEELKEAIGEFDVAHIFLLLTTVFGSAVSVYMGICRRFGKYSPILKKIGSCVGIQKNEPAKTPELQPQPLAAAPPVSEPVAEPPAKPPPLCPAPLPYAEPSEQHSPHFSNRTAPPCAPPSCNRTSYTLMHEKHGKVHCTQYSIKRWEYPLQEYAEGSYKNGTKTNFTNQ